jgi:protein-S-isoprenylcysteine O-methyltransferase Ste14
MRLRNARVGDSARYPALLAGVADIAGEDHRASTVGMYRFWRDLGYTGGIVMGASVDLYGAGWAIGAVAMLTALSGLIVAVSGHNSPRQSRALLYRCVVANQLHSVAIRIGYVKGAPVNPTMGRCRHDEPKRL